MDLVQILNDVKTLNDYISATQTIVKKCASLKIQLNVSTVLNLKKVRSLEIEYLNKCEDNGAAFIVFDRMLKQPPSKTWGFLGKDLILMLQYWLDAVRKHLINHSQHWWTFLNALLRFIKEIKSKDQCLLRIIVEQTTECLLDLACSSRLNELQRQIVLQTVNECCTDSSREQRTRMKDRFTGYFIKLGKILSSCGHSPTQVTILETLLRWLVGRFDPQIRRNVAEAWFPRELYRQEAVDLFLERPWKDFYKDARDFLNVHNADHPERVVSVVCKKLSVGGVSIINGPQSQVTWLDINSATRCLTVTLDSTLLESGAATKYEGYMTHTVSEEDVCSLKLSRAASETLLAVQTRAPLLLPGAGGRRGACHLTACVHSRRLADVDSALRAVFCDKYQVELHVSNADASSSDPDIALNCNTRKFSSSEEDRPAFIPLRRRRHSGYMVRSRNPLPWHSPSTVSTTSLAQLPDKLAALPNILYTKEPIKICAEPELSIIGEVSEPDERSSFSLSNSIRSMRIGVNQRQSDSELKNNGRYRKNLPSSQNKKKPVSLMLTATIRSGDESVINETCEKIYRDNADVDLLDLLVKEALQTDRERDSGIIPDTKTQDTEVIENTPLEKQTRYKKITKIHAKSKTKCTVVSNSTTDESNTEVVNETPCYVNDRRRRVITKDFNNIVAEQPNLLDTEAVDAFFSQHAPKNVFDISPTLAKKINETSSEASDDIIDGELNENDLMIEAEIIDCLNNIVDEVSSNFKQCGELLSKERDNTDILNFAVNIDTNQNMNSIKFGVEKEKRNKNLPSNDHPKAIMLKLQPTKIKVSKKQEQNTKQKKLKGKLVPDNITIEDDNVFIECTDTNSPVNKVTTPLIRKKRKLYSPKDNDNDAIEDGPKAKIESRKLITTRTPMSTCYKELEMARITRSKIPRKSRASTVPLTSPKTKKLNDMFDKLKQNIDNEENITKVNTRINNNDTTVYNYTSDSEDDDFIKKKNEVQKCVGCVDRESTATKRGRFANRVKYTDSNYNSSADESNRKTKKRKVVKQTKPRSRIVNKLSIDLIDEKMREPAPEILESSFVKETFVECKAQEPEPVIEQALVMETINDDINDAKTEIVMVPNKNQKKKRSDILKIKKEKGFIKKPEKPVEIPVLHKDKRRNKKGKENLSNNNKSEPGSPLPGLIVETVKSRKDDINASVEANMLQKFTKIYKEGPELDESDGTENLLHRVDTYNSPGGSNNDVNIDIFDRLDEIDIICTNKDIGKDFEINNPNERMQDQKKIGTFTKVLSDVLSEKSIATVGSSPITGHNNPDESPPNMALLQESFQDRDLEIQDMSRSMAEFFVQLRSGLQENRTPRASTEKSKDSLVLQSRLSSNECAMTPKSGISTPKVLLKRMSSKEIEKYVSPVQTKSGGGSRSPELVLERISSDEMNKWLPIPRRDHNCENEVSTKKYNTRLAATKSFQAAKTRERRETNKIKSIISPIKLSFDIDDNDKVSSKSSTKRNTNVLWNCKTATTTKSTTQQDFENLNGTPKTESHKSRVIETAEQSYIKQDKEANIESLYKSSAEIKDVDKHGISFPSASPESNASNRTVNEWFKKNVASSSSRADSNLGKEMLGKLMETLETTLDEIQQATGKDLASMLMENQRCLNRLQEESRALDKRTAAEIIAIATEKWAQRDQRLKEMVEEIEKDQKQRACDVIRRVRERTGLMVQLLKEDLQASLDFNDNRNKK